MKGGEGHDMRDQRKRRRAFEQLRCAPTPPGKQPRNACWGAGPRLSPFFLKRSRRRLSRRLSLSTHTRAAGVCAFLAFWDFWGGLAGNSRATPQRHQRIRWALTQRTQQHL
jgi:hypothetical protein